MKNFLLIIFINLLFISEIISQADSLKDLPNTKYTAIDSFSFLQKDTKIYKITKDKIYCFLTKNTKVQGLICRGNKHNGWQTVFYKNGNLALAWLYKSQIVQGIPCSGSSFWTEVFTKSAVVKFYPNGNLERCKLAKNITIQNKKLKKGTILRFDVEGNLLTNR